MNNKLLTAIVLATISANTLMASDENTTPTMPAPKFPTPKLDKIKYENDVGFFDDNMYEKTGNNNFNHEFNMLAHEPLRNLAMNNLNIGEALHFKKKIEEDSI